MLAKSTKNLKLRTRIKFIQGLTRRFNKGAKGLSIREMNDYYDMQRAAMAELGISIWEKTQAFVNPFCDDPLNRQDGYYAALLKRRTRAGNKHLTVYSFIVWDSRVQSAYKTESKGLRALLRTAPNYYRSIALVKRRADGSALLTVRMSSLGSFSYAVTSFASYEVCLQWLKSRKSWNLKVITA